MSANVNDKKKQKFVTESKRPNAVLLLSSEEELSDKRSSSSIESSPRQIEESKNHRSARKASKKSWQETLALLDCQFSSSSTDEEWNNMIPNNNTSDSDVDWSPMQKTQSRSSAPARLTNVGMKRAFAETTHSPAPVAEPNFKHLDSDHLSTPPNLMPIDAQPKRTSLKPHRTPVLKARPISLGGNEEQCLIEEQTSLTITEKEDSLKSSYLTNSKLGKNVEGIQEDQESLCSLRVPKVKATYKKTTKEFRSYQQENHGHSTVNLSPKPTSLSSSEEISVSVASPGPPELIPLFDKSKRDSPEPPLSFIEEAHNLFPIVNEDETSDSSLAPPILTIKSKKDSSQKSLELQLPEETGHNSGVFDEDQAMTPSPGPPTIMTNLQHPKRRSHKPSQPPIFNVEPMAVEHNEDQQFSVPAAPELTANVNKSKMRSKKSPQPQIQPEGISSQSSKSPVVPLKPRSTTRTKVERSSSKMSHLPPEDGVSITMLSQKEQSSKTSLSSPLKQMSKKKKSTPECSPLPTAKTMPSLPTIDEIHLSIPSPSEPTVDRSVSFAGIIPHNASLLEKGFDSGKFIMLKSDLKTQKSPSIWRIDGKNLLQKYESISYNDQIAYRNISTYSSWMASNKGLYVPIEVEFSVQSKSETIVTFDRNKVMLPVEDGMMEALNEEANSMIDTFQIYLQTLMSQALDSNFVKEIVKEQDDYFLTSIAVVEDHWILPKRNMLKEIIKLKKHFQELVETHPGLEIRCVTSGDKSCDSCNGRNPTRSFEFLPLSYTFDTLDIMEGSKTSIKTYRLCLSCTDRILLYHELFHMRYHLFICCQKKVNQYDQRDGPAALTSSLADQTWKSLMHRRVLLVLAETQQVISRYSADTSVV